MNIGDKIKEARLAKGLTQEELGKLLGVQKSAIAKYESGRVINIKRSTLKMISDILEIRPAELIFDGTPPSLPLSITPVTPHRRVPVLGYVAAGTPIVAEQEYDVYVDAPKGVDFALTIEGDSMNPTLLCGDVAFIRQTDDVRDGAIAVVILDDTATVKHIYHRKNGVLLVSENPAYEPMLKTFDDYNCISILGEVIGYQRLFKRVKL